MEILNIKRLVAAIARGAAGWFVHLPPVQGDERHHQRLRRKNEATLEVVVILARQH
jgi:hypothetical protein